MEQKCKEAFLAFASGELGMNMISEFVQILRQGYAVSLSHGLGPRQARAKTLFEAVLCGMGDIWKRLVQETRVFPFKMFQLCDLPPDKFWPLWSKFKQELENCPKCVDKEFSSGLLGISTEHCTPEELQTHYHEISALLHDLAVHVPLSTDAVECCHGHLQNRIQKFRGRGKLAAQCSARSVFESLVSTHGTLLHYVKEQTLPRPRSTDNILRPAPAFNNRDRPKKKQRNRELRAISGWNVFQRQEMQGSMLQKQAWKKRQRQVSQKWRRMSQDEKQPFNIRATWENEQRQRWLQTPLPAGSGLDRSEVVSEVGQRMTSKMNFDRLHLNLANLQQHSVWQRGLAIADADGALRADLIDTKTTDEDIAAFIEPLVQCRAPVADAPLSATANQDHGVHRGVCEVAHGMCPKNSLFVSVSKLAKQFTTCVRERNLESGALLQFWPDGSNPWNADSLTVFLATTYARPGRQILASASALAGNDGVTLNLLGNDQLPDLLSSQDMFHALLQLCGCTGPENCPIIFVRELDYEMQPVELALTGNRSLLCVQALVEKQQLALGQTRPRVKRRPKKMPFGLGKWSKKSREPKTSQESSRLQARRALDLLRSVQSAPAQARSGCSEDLQYCMLLLLEVIRPLISQIVTTVAL